MSATRAFNEMFDYITGVWKSWIVTAAVELNICTHLSMKPMSIEELAEYTETDKSSLTKLMSALEVMKVVRRDEEKFVVTETGELLNEDNPMSLANLALLYVRDTHKMWSLISNSMKTGESSFIEAYGAPFYQYLNDNPKVKQNWVEHNTRMNKWTNPDVIQWCDFSMSKVVMDLGGGDGVFSILLLKANPHLEAIIIDQSFVIPKTIENIEKNGLKGRCKAIVGDLMQEIPCAEKTDCFILKMTLVNYEDNDAIKLLSNIKKVMKEESRLLIIEIVVDNEEQTMHFSLTDLFAHLLIGGNVRSKSDIKRLVSTSGLKVTQIKDTSVMTIIEVAK